MNHRIVEIRQKVGKTSKEFAEQIGFTQGFLSHMEKGTRNITERAQKLICSEFNVNPEWLKSGIGEMFLPNKNDPIEELCLQNGIEGYAKTIAKAYVKLNEADKKTFERFLKNLFIEWQEQVEETLSISEDEYTRQAVQKAEEQARREYRQAKEALKGEFAQGLLEKAG